MTKTNIYRVKGGSGATTIACALAMTATRPTVLAALNREEFDDLAACLAMPTPPDDAAQVNDTVTLRLMSWDEFHDVDDTLTDYILSSGKAMERKDDQIGVIENILVTRCCYLACRKAIGEPLQPDSIIVVEEPGRALTTRDVERCLSRPVITTIRWDPAVSRCVDAGLMVSRLPDNLRKPITRLHSKENA